MKWQLKEPTFGDIIRVKTGSIFHYGIYVGDDEVIQFGLPPVSRLGVADADVQVCASTIDDFLVGGFLEVGSAEKRDKKRFSPKKTVQLARARLGQKGYHILNNNCEHFANECFNGQKYSSQTDFVRELFRNMPVVDVYTAQIPEVDSLPKVVPPARQKEIDIATHPLVKREKHFVWKLLSYAIKQSFGRNLSDVKVKKCSTGKWVCDVCEFSLSHGDGLVCVAVSKTPVGVDIQKIAPTKVDLSQTILSQDEYAQYQKLSVCDQTKFIIDIWTKKESLFKRQNARPCTRTEFKQLDGTVFQTVVTIDGCDYSLAVATDHPDKVKLHQNVNLS